MGHRWVGGWMWSAGGSSLPALTAGDCLHPKIRLKGPGLRVTTGCAAEGREMAPVGPPPTTGKPAAFRSESWHPESTSQGLPKSCVL